MRRVSLRQLFSATYTQFRMMNTTGTAGEYSRDHLYSYQPPKWASSIPQAPSLRLHLAQLPTPIHRWQLPGVPDQFEVFVKRDDLSGAAMSGNKVRKLEFLLADALSKKCDSVITLGGIQSNHCRTTAVAARQIGLQPHLLLRTKEMDPSKVGCEGNLLLNRLVGAKITLCPYCSSDEELVDGKVIKGLYDMMMDYAGKLREEGSTPYCIPVGGSNSVGIWGYIEAFEEMRQQGVLDNFDDIFMAIGSGGTCSGVAIANYLTGSKLKVHAVCVCDQAEYFYGHIDEQLKQSNLLDSEGKQLRAVDIVDIIDGYKGNGYSVSTEEELAQLIDISRRTGIVVDHTYTLKAVRGMLEEMKTRPERFKGRRALFLHTGGLYSNYDKRLDQVLKATPETNKIYSFQDIISEG